MLGHQINRKATSVGFVKPIQCKGIENRVLIKNVFWDAMIIA